jgi:hypothetical protein
MGDFDWPAAERLLARGRALSPGSAFVLDMTGLLLTAQLRYEEALSAQRRSRELDPLTLVHTTDLATTRIRAGRYDAAIQEARHVVATEPAWRSHRVPTRAARHATTWSRSGGSYRRSPQRTRCDPTSPRSR